MPNEFGEGIESKKLIVKPVVTSILDKTIGRYQAIASDPKLVHAFIKDCGDELQSLLVSFYETNVMNERARIATVLQTQQHTILRNSVGAADALASSVLGESFSAGGASATRSRAVSVAMMRNTLLGRAESIGSASHQSAMFKASSYKQPLLSPEYYTTTEAQREKQERDLMAAGAVSREEINHRHRVSREANTAAQVEAMMTEGEAIRIERAQAVKEGMQVGKGPSVPPLRLPSQTGSSGSLGIMGKPVVTTPHAGHTTSYGSSREASVLGSRGASFNYGSSPQQQQQKFHTLVNQLDTLQAELDIAHSDQNFLRSIAGDVIRELEGKDSAILALKGSLGRRDQVINEQRRAYIFEMLHLREMIRQYKEKGRCDLADVSLYSWDTNAVQRFQEEEVVSKIEAAVAEARRLAQTEREAMEAAYKRQLDDQRKKIALMSEIGMSPRAWAAERDTGVPSPSTEAFDGMYTGRPIRSEGTIFMSPSVGGDLMTIRETATVNDLTGGVSSSRSNSSSSTMNGEDSIRGRARMDRRPTRQGEGAEGRGTPPGGRSPTYAPNAGGSINSSFQDMSSHIKGSFDLAPSPILPITASTPPTEIPNYSVNKGKEEGLPTKPAKVPKKVVKGKAKPKVQATQEATSMPTVSKLFAQLYDEEDEEDEGPSVPYAHTAISTTTGSKQSSTTTAVNPSHSSSAIGDSRKVPHHRSFPVPLTGIALDNQVEVLESRLAQRDAVIERLRLLIVSASGEERDGALPKSPQTIRNLSPRAQQGTLLRSELSLLDDACDVMRRQEELQDMHMTKASGALGAEASDPSSGNQQGKQLLSSATKVPARPGSGGAAPRVGVAFGTATRPPSANTLGGPTTNDLHRQIFSLQRQLSNVTASFEQLCHKSKRWFEAYRQQKNQLADNEARIAAEGKLRHAVLVAEAAEETYRVHGWRVLKAGAQYKECIAGQRADVKAAEATSSYGTMQLQERRLEVLERALSRKLLMLRQQHQSAREEANEAWDLVLIHAKEVAKAVQADADREGEPLSARATVSSTIRTADSNNKASPNEATDRALLMHREACAQRRQLNASAQQRLIEKYAVANVVKRYLRVGGIDRLPMPAAEHDTLAGQPRAATVMSVTTDRPAASSYPTVPIRPNSAAVTRNVQSTTADKLPVVEDLVDDGISWGTGAEVPPVSDSLLVDPRAHLVVRAEADRVARVKELALRQSLKGLGVVERLTRQRLQAAEVEAQARTGKDESTGTVLGGDEIELLPQEKVTATSATPNPTKPPTSRPSSATFNSNFSSMKAYSPSPTGVKRPQSAAGIPLGGKRQAGNTYAAPVPTPSPAPTDAAPLNLHAFRSMGPKEKRAELMHLMHADQAQQMAERKREVSEVYALKATAVAINTGPHGPGLVVNAIGTFTTEQELIAGIYRKKLFGRAEKPT